VAEPLIDIEKSERLLRLVLDTLPVGVVVVAAAGDVVLANAISSRIWGGMIRSGKERWARSMGTWRDSGKPVGEWPSQSALSRGETRLNELIDIETLDGNHKTIRNSTAPIRDQDQTIIGAVVVNEDVTERTRAEEALRQSEKLLAQAEALGHTGSWEFDLISGEIFSTAENRRLFFGDESGKGTKVEDYVATYHPDDVDRLLRRHAEIRVGGVTGEIEFRILRPDGSVRWILGRVQMVGEENGKPVRAYGTNTDVTERKRAEEALREAEKQLRQAHKMEAIGRLAGGVAHDFNNLLSVILSYAEILATEMDPRDPLRPDVEEIQAAGKRASTLTRQLLAFSRHNVLQPKVIDLNEIVEGMESLVRRLIGEDLELTVAPSPRPSHVHADPGQMEQVVMNLAVNARDAMPQGGRLAIEIGNLILDAVNAPPGLAPGSYVMLSVKDTGTGMDERTQARIFEPFFTTKEVGKGTGLGLSTVFGIVRQSGGTIAVDSAPTRGATFQIYLPAVDPQSAAGISRPAEGKPARRNGSETILLVDDDDQVRKVAHAILAREGYRVLDAGTAADALLLCERHEGRIDLLLADVVMPHMSGGGTFPKGSASSVPRPASCTCPAIRTTPWSSVASRTPPSRSWRSR
jgi:two-component system cell cycle sensor histidine kinase/response regulator CckA